MVSFDDLLELHPQFEEILKLERIIAKKEMDMVHQESVRAKARANYAGTAHEFALSSQKFSEQFRQLMEKKKKERTHIGLQESEINREERAINFYEVLAKAELEFAEIHKRLAILEKETAAVRFEFVKKKSAEVEEGFKLIKKAKIFAGTSEKGLPLEKVSQKQQEYINQQKIYISMKETVLRLSNRLNEVQKQHAELKQHLAEKISEREKLSLRNLESPRQD